MEWLRYKDPADETDAKRESDMHTFISVINGTAIQDMKGALELIKNIGTVSESVENVWCESLANGDAITRKRCLANIITLQSLMLEKLDDATIRLLRFVDSMLNDRQELNYEEEVDKFSLGMWSSFNDIRPIRKSIQLEKMGIQLDIPKQLLSQNEKYIYRLVRIPISTFNLEAFSPDAISADVTRRSKYVLGGLIKFDILNSPPTVINLRAKKWLIRDCSSSSTTLRKSNYPSSVASRMLLKVPANIIWSDDIRVAG